MYAYVFPFNNEIPVLQRPSYEIRLKTMIASRTQENNSKVRTSHAEKASNDILLYSLKLVKSKMSTLKIAFP